MSKLGFKTANHIFYQKFSSAAKAQMHNYITVCPLSGISNLNILEIETDFEVENYILYAFLSCFSQRMFFRIGRKGRLKLSLSRSAIF